MTYCAGWKYGNTSFLIADSAITSSAGTAGTGLSSFGETHRRTRDGFVEEGLLKLAPIGQNAAAAFAGDVHLASEILEFLIRHGQSFDNRIEATIRAIESSFGPLLSAPEVAFIFAFWSDEGPHLAQWNSRYGLMDVNDDCYRIGSLRTYHTSLTTEVLRQLSELSVPLDDVLPAVTALVQSYGVHDNLIDQNVGGTVFGLSVGPKGVAWQRDTGYMLYSRHNQGVDFVDARVRDNALVVHSSLTDETRVMMNSATVDWKKWLSDWEHQIKRERTTDHFSVVVFVRKDDKLVTLLDRKPQRDGLIRFRKVGNNLHLDLSEEICRSLDADLGKSLTDAPPFRLVYLRDM